MDGFSTPLTMYGNEESCRLNREGFPCFTNHVMRIVATCGVHRSAMVLNKSALRN